jgi:hypothetical protein
MKNKFCKASFVLTFLSCNNENGLNKNNMIKSSDLASQDFNKKEYETYKKL